MCYYWGSRGSWLLYVWCGELNLFGFHVVPFSQKSASFPFFMPNVRPPPTGGGLTCIRDAYLVSTSAREVPVSLLTSMTVENDALISSM